MAKDDLRETLDRFRREIDALDDRLLALLEERAKLTSQVGDLKRAHHYKTYAVLEREAEIIDRLRQKSALLQPYIAPIYREIISACVSFERPTAVAYLGPEGTFSHEAALKNFGHSAQLKPMPGITAAFHEAGKSAVDFAVVPFENSAIGAVGETLDELLATPLQVSGEVLLRIRHNLLVPPSHADKTPADIVEIHAHPQALGQCRQWLRMHAPQAELRASVSTAAAATKLGEGKDGVAVIGSSLAQEIYGLSALAEDIEDHPNNSTRFLILGGPPPKPTGGDKTSLVMAVREEAGAMVRLLKPFSDNGVNMTKFESRPSPGGLWQYVFFVDIDGHRDDTSVADALGKMKTQAAFLKVLGSYPRAPD